MKKGAEKEAAFGGVRKRELWGGLFLIILIFIVIIILAER
jgi:hypothetical protein